MADCSRENSKGMGSLAVSLLMMFTSHHRQKHAVKENAVPNTEYLPLGAV